MNNQGAYVNSLLSPFNTCQHKQETGSLDATSHTQVSYSIPLFLPIRAKHE